VIDILDIFAFIVFAVLLNDRPRSCSTSLKRQRRAFAGASGLCCIIGAGDLAAAVAIYTNTGKPVHIISKVAIRMKKWLLYVVPS
jgi:hypothetical protein